MGYTGTCPLSSDSRWRWSKGPWLTSSPPECGAPMVPQCPHGPRQFSGLPTIGHEAHRRRGDAGSPFPKASLAPRWLSPKHPLVRESPPSRPLTAVYWLLWGLGKVGQVPRQLTEGAPEPAPPPLLGSFRPKGALPCPPLEDS